VQQPLVFEIKNGNNGGEFNFFPMIAGKQYQHSEDRTIFRLRDPELHPQKDFDPNVVFPPRYPDLTDDEKLHVTEFVDFIFAHRDEIVRKDDLHFRIRDHENRPSTTNLPVSDKIPHRYDELNSEEKAHVFELISFLIKRREKEN